MERYFFVCMMIVSGQLHAQEWWNITYHQGSGANSNTINRENKTQLVNTDVPPPSEEMLKLKKTGSVTSLKSQKKRLKKMGEERQDALGQLAKIKSENESGEIIDCRHCEGTGIKICMNCEGNGYRDCSICNGKGIHTCRTCRGVGTIRDVETCLSCSGSGTNSCTSCMGQGKKPCSDCIGLGVNGCTSCSGAGKEFVYSLTTIKNE
jgi:hypothetical protein